MKGDRKTTKPIGRGKSKTKKAQGTLKVIAPKPAEEKLTIANTELAFQNEEKEKRAAELALANKELAFQNDEKEKRAAELVLANRELAFQNHEKEKRADELLMANKELLYQNDEKEKRAAELVIANKELLYQNDEKEKRAAELVLANKELAFQNREKEKRAAELVIANKELAFQNEEKEKRAAELSKAVETLKRNEELLSQTGKMAKVGGWELDLQTMKLTWSLETYRIHEVDPSLKPDLENAINFYAPEARPIISEAVQRAMNEGAAFDLELPFITATGKPIWVHSIGQAEFRDGKCVRLFGTFQDITERKLAESKFSSLLESAPDAMVVVDQQGRIAMINKQTETLFGYTREELVGQPIEVIIPERFRSTHPAHRSAYSNAPSIRTMGAGLELAARRKDGSEFPVDISLSPLETAEGLLINAAIRDITKKKKSEITLQNERDKAIQYFDTTSVMMVRLDHNGYVSQINRKGCEVLGYSAGELVGKDWFETVLPKNTWKDVRGSFEEIMDGNIEAVEFYENPVVNRNGEERLIEWHNALLLDVDGKPIGTLSSGVDITDRKQAEEELIIANKETIRRLQNIQALQKIDQAIAGSLDLNLTLRVVLEQTKTELNVDAAAVLLCNPHTQILEFTAGIGFRTKAIERSRLRLGEGHGGRAALERRTVSVTNLLDAERSDQFVRAPFLADEGFITYFGTPLIAKGQVRGVLEVFHRSPFIPNQDWLDFLEVLAGQAAIAVDSANLFTDLQRSNTELFNAYDSTIEGWSHALDLRDKETEGHTLRVTEMALKLAHAAGITEAELVHVRRGALLHDIGKMGVPDNILLKPDKLTDEEWIAMRKHPTFAFELLSPIAYLRPALDIPYCHHEKWDGSGYPRGLKGEQIPLAARLFAIIDVWDALRSDRPYRQGWSKEKVIDHIKSLSGTHFEPKAVELFLNMLVELSKDQAE